MILRMYQLHPIFYKKPILVLMIQTNLLPETGADPLPMNI